ncbi:LysR family transcriptional regulator [Caballeronia insecticola]|uniref:LysR family transcriptional regulator n=1 Tax=Caballeronia insecticola TaxID=758793 RepID=UPI0005C78C9D|nr:LysR substrate-binding domain-containing protein [Caballeronia insecticola]
MNFTHLLAFYEVARAGSISAGAQRLHVSQPAVTREIRELEERLGVTLFDRLPRGVALTQVGNTLLEYATRIFALSEAAERELTELAGLTAGQLLIGASATVGVYLVPAVIAQFNVLFPKVTVELTVANTEQVEQGLLAHAFGLGFIEGPYDAAVFDANVIGADEIIAVAAVGHPLAKRRFAARELADKAVILREPGSGTRAAVEDAYKRAGLSMTPLMSVSHTEAIKRMLLSGQAIAYVSSLSVAEEIARGDLVRLKVIGVDITRLLHVVWLKGRSFAPSTEAFVKLFDEQFPPRFSSVIVR